jgi:spore coat protein H
MATSNPSAGKLLKIALIGVVVFTFAFVLLVAGVIQWIGSIRAQAQPNPRPFENRQNFVAEGPMRPPFEVPKDFTTNAILAGKYDKAYPGDDIFVELAIPKIQIDLESSEFNKLRRAPREYALATVFEGDKVYTNVSIKLKGSVGSFREIHDQPSFTLNFDKQAEGQTFHGLKKIHLNASPQDRSYLEEKISRELFDAAGVPVPRAGHAVVKLNDREMRLYVLVEGVNKQFLKRYFEDAGGNVYDGHSGSEVDQRMPTNSGDNPRDKSRLLALGRAAKEPNLAVRLAALEETLDIDRFLSFMAMEMILWHWDGYTMHRNNFRVFHDRSKDRMVFIPQGMDQMLNNPGNSVMPQPSGLVARSVLEIPELRQRYRARVAEIATNIFHPDVIASRIYEVSTNVQAALAEVAPGMASAHAGQADALRRRVRQRADYLERFISPPRPVKFDDLGLASLTTWKPKKDLGEAVLNMERETSEKTLLHISTEDGCTASWRTVVKLPPGQYSLEASIKTRGVVLYEGDPRSGAGLRISRHRQGQPNEGDSDWKPISFEFEVEPEQSEVELICELRAEHGEIWYDLNSLKLKRL